MFVKAIGLFVSVMALMLLVIPMIALNFELDTTQKVDSKVHVPQVVAPKPVAAEDSYPPQIEPVEAEQSPVVDATDDLIVQEQAEADAYAEEELAPASQEKSVLSFKILDKTSGEINEVSLRDFVRGAVAAEMPASFHSEALKAQAVAAHTFALHNHIVQQKTPDSALMGADFEADPSNMKVYITEEIAKEFYGGGETADLYWSKICKAADSVVNYVLEYDDEPIVAAYHAISAGKTEDAANVWSGSAPYLQSVTSEGDVLAPNFETTVKLTEQEAKATLTSAYPDIKLGADASQWFSQPQRSESGYVSEISVGDKQLQGKDVREIFGLRSHDFEVSYNNSNFIFTVTGYGHGVGLSQYGADFLARQGKSFDEILSTYYTDAVLKTATE